MAQSEMTLHVVMDDLPYVVRVITAAVNLVEAISQVVPEPGPLVVELREALLALAEEVPVLEDPH